MTMQIDAPQNVCLWPLATARRVAIAVANGRRTDISLGRPK